MSKLRSALAEVRKFCAEIARQLDAAPPQPLTSGFGLPGRTVSSADLGGFSLDEEETRRYHQVLQGLVAAAGPKMTEGGLARVFDRAVLTTLGPPGSRPSAPPEKRAGDAVQELERMLTTPPVQWTNYIPLVGLTPPAEPWSLGDVVIFDLAHEPGRELFRHLDQITDAGTDPPESREAWRRNVRKSLADSHAGQAFAAVTNEALEADAAWSSAKKRLRFVMDCLNFALDVLHGPHLRHEVSDDQPRRPYRVGVTLQSSDFSAYHLQHERAGSGPTVKADELRAAIDAEPRLQRLFAWLASSAPDAHQERVLAAVHWAGRAAVAERPEEAFLHRAIALESFVLGRKGAEITTRLVLSTVHLLGPWLVDRKKFVKDLKALYQVRSDIVHSGTYEVVPADLALLRTHLNRVFARVLGDEPFISMRAAEDLDEWFEAALRGDGHP